MLAHCINWKKLDANPLKTNNFKGLFGLLTAPFICFLLFTAHSCSKKNATVTPPNLGVLQLESVSLNGKTISTLVTNVPVYSKIQLNFSKKLDTNQAKKDILLKEGGFTPATVRVKFLRSDSSMVLDCINPLKYFTRYVLAVPVTVKAINGATMQNYTAFQLRTGIDTSQKRPYLSESQLLDSIQLKTLNFFWKNAHPVSGLARERNSSGDIVTTGGSGFGVMALIAAADRNFLSRTQVVTHLNKVTNFLLHKTKTYHGAFPHWLNGNTGATIPFSANDDGADLVETSYMIQGLLSAQEYFSGSGSDETLLRNTIDTIWRRVEWSWFTKNGTENNLYWHWSPTKGFIMNMPIRGWCEGLITHILAASSPTYPVKKAVYDQCWASNGSIKNGKSFYGYNLPLGPDYGGPLFFAHYTFLGIDPRGLKDQYADYWTQNLNHSLINYTYCKNNPKGYACISENCWGITASDDPWGYDASSPTNDHGTIAPTAALSSMPYTPTQSLNAARYFYQVLGDRIWKDGGFVDAFNINETWVADSYLAIDQGPIIIMIENYRSQLLWRMFTQSADVKSGLRKLGFTAPYL